MKRISLLLIVAITFIAILAQGTEAFYIYKTDGSFNAFSTSEIDSIKSSKVDLDSIEQSQYVTQDVYTADTILRIPLSVIDNMALSSYVDLGLSVKWAPCNVGACSPEDYGNYYTWQAASSFSLPTKAQMDELVEKCTWEGSILNGVAGVKVTGTNGNSIFMPCAGDRFLGMVIHHGTNGYYWSSTLDPDDSKLAYHLIISNEGNRLVYSNNLKGELTVRPVSQ